VRCRLTELGIDGKTSACIEQYLNNVEKMKFRRSRVLVLFVVAESYATTAKYGSWASDDNGETQLNYLPTIGAITSLSKRPTTKTDEDARCCCGGVICGCVFEIS